MGQSGEHQTRNDRAKVAGRMGSRARDLLASRQTLRAKRAHTETAISRSIRRALAAKGCRCIRIQSGILRVQSGSAGRSYFVHCAEPGTPDLLVIRAGVYTWLEVKRPGEEPTPEQCAWHLWARKQGLRVAVVHSIAEALRAVFDS